jgi:HemY protein
LADAAPAKAALAAAASQEESNNVRAIQLARRAWKDDPALPASALAYAKRLRLDGRESRAQSILAQSWTLAPHPDLAAFALAPVTDKLARAKAAQKLAAKNPEHVESQLLLARAALDAGLTGEARRQAEAARAAGVNQRRLWLLIAEIEEEERGGTEAGRAAQRDALRAAARAEPDPVWRCTTCHTPQDRWLPACPACLSTASLRWGEARPIVASVPAIT